MLCKCGRNSASCQECFKVPREHPPKKKHLNDFDSFTVSRSPVSLQRQEVHDSMTPVPMWRKLVQFSLFQARTLCPPNPKYFIKIHIYMTVLLFQHSPTCGDVVDTQTVLLDCFKLPCDNCRLKIHILQTPTNACFRGNLRKCGGNIDSLKLPFEHLPLPPQKILSVLHVEFQNPHRFP